jgi:ribosomal protein S18 acetylase RimI-like enzyme
MRIERIDIDSEVLSGTVLELAGVAETVEPDAFAELERQYVATYQPLYVGCKVPLSEISTIHMLEEHGFRFVEVQFQTTYKIRERYDLSQHPYEYRPAEEADLAALEQLVAETFNHDRYSVDPDLPEGAGGKRYARYVAKSVRAADEFAFKLVNTQTSEIVGFHTYAYSGGTQARFYLAGVRRAYRGSGLGLTLNQYAINEMHDRGIRKITTHQSAANHAIINLEVGYFGFRVVQSFAALRKLYAG